MILVAKSTMLAVCKKILGHGVHGCHDERADDGLEYVLDQSIHYSFNKHIVTDGINKEVTDGINKDVDERHHRGADDGINKDVDDGHH